MPEKYENTVSANPTGRVTADDGRTWYDWQQENWGCKWGDKDLTMSLQNDTLLLEFATPWGPPLQGLVTISLMFPGLEFLDDWDEESPSKGIVRIKAGEVLEDVAL